MDRFTCAKRGPYEDFPQHHARARPAPPDPRRRRAGDHRRRRAGAGRAAGLRQARRDHRHRDPPRRIAAGRAGRRLGAERRPARAGEPQQPRGDLQPDSHAELPRQRLQQGHVAVHPRRRHDLHLPGCRAQRRDRGRRRRVRPRRHGHARPDGRRADGGPARPPGHTVRQERVLGRRQRRLEENLGRDRGDGRPRLVRGR